MLLPCGRISGSFLGRPARIGKLGLRQEQCFAVVAARAVLFSRLCHGDSACSFDVIERSSIAECRACHAGLCRRGVSPYSQLPGRLRRAERELGIIGIAIALERIKNRLASTQSCSIWRVRASHVIKFFVAADKLDEFTISVRPYRSPSKSNRKTSSTTSSLSNVGRRPTYPAPCQTSRPGHQPNARAPHRCPAAARWFPQ